MYIFLFASYRDIVAVNMCLLIIYMVNIYGYVYVCSRMGFRHIRGVDESSGLVVLDKEMPYRYNT